MTEETQTDGDPSIEEILDSIRQIISEDEDEAAAEPAEGGDGAPADDGPLDQSAIDDMDFDAPASEPEEEEALNQDDLDALFEEDGSEEDVSEEPVAEEEPPAEEEIIELTERVGEPGAIEEDVSEEPVAEDEGIQVDLVDAEDEEVAEEEAMAEEVVEEPPVEEAIAAGPAEEEEHLLTNKAEAAAVSAITELVRKTAVEHNGVTLEDIVRSEIKPLLRDWLDKNLPIIIERLVAEELERVSKRALDE